MTTLKDFSSIQPTFTTNVQVEKSPKFLFVTISNPNQIKSRRKQNTIRSHAKRKSDQERKRKLETRTERLNQEFQVELSAPQHGNKQINQRNEADIELIIEQDGSRDQTNHELDSLAFLKPIGAGRGFNPFSPYPFQLNSKTTQLLDRCMFLWSFIIFVVTNDCF
jgi:hypothetical protein